MTVLKKMPKRFHSVMTALEVETEAQREARLAAAKERSAVWWVQNLMETRIKHTKALMTWTCELQATLMDTDEGIADPSNFVYKMENSSRIFEKASETWAIAWLCTHVSSFLDKGKTHLEAREATLELARREVIRLASSRSSSTCFTSNLMADCRRQALARGIEYSYF